MTNLRIWPNAQRIRPIGKTRNLTKCATFGQMRAHLAKCARIWPNALRIWPNALVINAHLLTAALDQLRVIASSTSSDPGLRSGQHQQTGQCLLPLVAAKLFVDDPADASSQRREECQCGLLLTVAVAVPAKQVCSPVGDRCDRIMNDVCQQ